MKDLAALAADAAALFGGEAADYAAAGQRVRAGVSLAHGAADLYERLHWGRRGQNPTLVSSVPDPSQGVVELGRLAEIAYLTRKGHDRQVYAYTHRFGRAAKDPPHLESGRCPHCGHGLDVGRFGDVATLPILGVTTRDHGLVIVRDASRYTVRGPGIIG